MEMTKIPLNTWYDANFDPEILKEREKADALYWQFNQLSPADTEQKKELLQRLFYLEDDTVTILAPVYTDYIQYTSIGSGSFVNHGAYFMDGGTIRIGRNCFIGPFCGFYTASHPLKASERNTGLEKAQPIVLEDNVWLGGNVTILPGVTIGEGSVIGAKSLVTRDIPPHSLAVGSPCRVIRKITDQDSIAPITEV